MLNTKILIVDDHPIYLDGLQLIFSDIISNAEFLRASSIKEAKLVIEQHVNIDWVILDQNLPDGSGLKLLKELRDSFLASPIIMVSALDDISLIDECLNAGANGFIGKDSSKDVYAQSLKEIEKGKVFLTANIHKQISYFRQFTQGESKYILSVLTVRQKQILPLLMEGYTNQEIAESIGISLSTVKHHVTGLINNFNCENRTHCAAEARRLGLQKYLEAA